MALVTPWFVDTSVIVGGIVDLGPSKGAAQRLMDILAKGELARPLTAWHCCLEFYSVVTRLPPALRVTPEDAARLLREEVLERFEVRDLPSTERAGFVDALIVHRIGGGRTYDAHIAEVARAAACKTVVTDNPRHFSTLRSHGVKVLTSREVQGDLA